MKRKGISLLLAISMLFSLASTAYASYDPVGRGYYNGYSGENYYNNNYSRRYYGNYYMSGWAEPLKVAYDPTWYESPQRQVARGEAFLLYLRAVQRSLDRQGYSRLRGGYEQPPFSDYNSINPYAQSEVNVLWSNGILVGYEDNTMRFPQLLKRSEMAAIYSRFNRIFFNMGTSYQQYNYDGYNNYYNNNYNTYYNNYVFNDIVGHWAQQDIITAAANGVLAGVGNGYFDTEGPLTVEQIWQILDRCVGYQGLKRSDIAYAMSQTFKVKFGKNIDETYGTSNGIKITRLTASTTTLFIDEGETRNIKVNIYPTKSEYQKLNWTSSNTNYVSVEESWNSSSGVAYVSIYGRRAYGGYVTLTGRALDGSGKTVTIRVKVNSNNDYDDYDDGYITSISPSESTIYLDVGESTQINARIRPSGAYNKNLRWSSRDVNIAYISNIYVSGSYSYANITGSRAGTTYVYVTSQDGSGIQKKIRVVVGNESNTENTITSATANPSSISGNVGKIENVSVFVYPANANNRSINWVSDNTNVARVEKQSDTTIRVVLVGAGNTTIRGIAVATGNTVCTIPVTVSSQETVNPGIADTTPPIVTLEGSGNVLKGQTIRLTAIVYDDNIQNFNITAADVLGINSLLSVQSIVKQSDGIYSITLQAGYEVGSAGVRIAAGVATDAAGNVSDVSTEAPIYVTTMD